MKIFSIKEAVRRGWEIWKGNKKLLTIVTLISFIVSILGPDKWEGFGIVNVLFWALSALVSIGWMKILLKVEGGETAVWKEIFNHARYFWKYAIAGFLFFLGSVIGLILLIIPGVYFILKYQFTIIFILDKDMGIKEAFRESAKITKGVKWKLLGFFFVALGINILGAVALGIGLLVSSPVVALAYIYIYRTLSAEVSNVAPSAT